MAKGLGNLNSLKDLELVYYKCDLSNDGFTRILGAVNDQAEKIEKLYLNFARFGFFGLKFSGMRLGIWFWAF
jgi:hypothetical protein